MGVDVGFGNYRRAMVLSREETNHGMRRSGSEFSPRDPAFRRAFVAALRRGASRRISDREANAPRIEAAETRDPKVSHCGDDGIWSRRRKLCGGWGRNYDQGRTVLEGMPQRDRGVPGAQSGNASGSGCFDPPGAGAAPASPRRRNISAWPDPWRVPPAVGSPRPDGRWRTLRRGIPGFGFPGSPVRARPPLP